MNERIATWFPLLILAILAAITFWLDRTITYADSGRAGVPRHDPDYIVDGLTAISLDARGEMKQKLTAEEMRHFPDDDSTVLKKPTFVNLSPGRPSLTVTSDTARISGDGKDIHFHDNVHVVRAAFAPRPELTLSTSYLHVTPDTNLAVTDRPVRISDAYTVVDANGLELNGATRVLKLVGRVKGIYHEPSSRTRR